MKVLAGDWKAGCGVMLAGPRLQFQRGTFSFDYVAFSDIDTFDVVTEENRASIFGKVGWGAVGAIALGPLGLLAGVLGGGNRRERVMVMRTIDGRRAMIKGTAKDVERIKAAMFGREEPPALPPSLSP